jgi:ABC-2 type transport system ATP-binding protein
LSDSGDSGNSLAHRPAGNGPMTASRPARAALTTRGLGKVFGGWFGRGVEALAGLDLQVERGEVVGFLGPNGAGKTTTVHLLMGFLKPTVGEAFVLGEPAGTPAVYRRVGFLPENLTFYPYLTGYQLLELFSRLLEMDSARARRRIGEVQEMLPLEGADARKVGACSRGMLQRLGLAQALLGDPELLLLDEPASGLDPVGRRDIRRLLETLRAQGKAVLLSSHILSDIEEVCDRVAILKSGRVVCQGRLADLLRESSRVTVRAGGLPTERLTAMLSAGQEVAVDDDGAVRARFASPDAAQAAVAVLVGAGGRLVEMKEDRGHLEDLFVEVVTGRARS